MKHLHFDIDRDGFYGAYWTGKAQSDCAVIAMLGDDPEDYMARSAVKWLLKQGGKRDDHGTHFVFPEGMLKTMLPVGADLFVKLAFREARVFPRECKAARLDIQRRVVKALADWQKK